MVWCLGEVLREEVHSVIRSANYFSLLVDETTDVSVLKQLIIYSKVVVKEQTVFKFLALDDLPNGTADTITQGIRNYCTDNNITVKGRLAALGSDGAAVMVGRKTGVAVQLQQDNDFILNHHCVAHRLALAVKQAADSFPAIKKFNHILDDLYKYYEYSPVRLSGLKEIQKCTENPQLKLKQAKAVRWLSHDKACDTLRQIYPSVVLSLEREAQERHCSHGLGLAKFLQRENFIHTLYMMCDILPQLSILSKCFQTTAVDLTVIQDLIQTTLDILDSRLIRPGKHMLSVQQAIKDYRDNNLAITAPVDFDNFKVKTHDPYINAVIQNIKDRFPHTGVLASFSCFHPALTRPCSTVDDLQGYADDKFETVKEGLVL